MIKAKSDIVVEKKTSKLKILYEFFLLFLSVSTIHGFNHIAEKGRHIIEVIIWTSIVAVAVYGATILSSLTLTRYQENPTVISMERDRFSWNTSFPGASICPSFKLSETLLEEYIEKSPETNKELLREFLESLANATYENFDKVVKYDGIKPEDYMKIILQLSFEFKPSVSNSGVNGHSYLLQQVITEMGICYSFNSQLAIYSSPTYWIENNWKMLKQNNTFFVNPLDGEVFANVVNMSTGFSIFLHGPYEVADVASKGIFSPNGYFLQVYLAALTLYTSARAKSLSVNQRKCRFYDESELRHTPVYSYVLCRMECRLNLAKKLCGCIPHFYRKMEGDVVCSYKGLHCLADYKDRIIMLKKECNCLPNCEDTNYIVEHLDTREWFLGSNLQWGLKEYPRMRLKRDVIFTFADMLVYIGGMAGLFLGCSVLSFIEIVYFFTIRLFWFVIRYGKETEEQIREKKDEIISIRKR